MAIKRFLVDEHDNSNRLVTNRIMFVLDSEHHFKFIRSALTFKICIIENVKKKEKIQYIKNNWVKPKITKMKNARQTYLVYLCR